MPEEGAAGYAEPQVVIALVLPPVLAQQLHERQLRENNDAALGPEPVGEAVGLAVVDQMRHQAGRTRFGGEQRHREIILPALLFLGLPPLHMKSRSAQIINLHLVKLNYSKQRGTVLQALLGDLTRYSLVVSLSLSRTATRAPSQRGSCKTIVVLSQNFSAPAMNHSSRLHCSPCTLTWPAEPARQHTSFKGWQESALQWLY